MIDFLHVETIRNVLPLLAILAHLDDQQVDMVMDANLEMFAYLVRNNLRFLLIYI